MKCLPVLILTAGFAAFAQTSNLPRRAASKSAAPKEAAPPQANDRWPIVKLEVEGNHRYTAEQVLAVAGLKVGQMAGKEEFDAARDRLVASGYFEMVAYRFEPAPGQNGEVGTFQVTEAEPSYPVHFLALGVPPAELEKVLREKDPMFSASAIPPTKPVLDRYVGWIQGYLTSKGSTEKVVARVDVVGESLAVVFRPARSLPVVAQVTFTGNKVVPQAVLRDAISGVAVGVPYTEEQFRQLLNTGVRPVYEARGRLRVAFTNIRTEPVSDVGGLHVFVTVSEGDSYQLSKVEIAGPTPVRPEQLLKAGEIPTGDTANFDRVNDGLEKMRKALVRTGYLDAKLSFDRAIDDAKKTVAVAVHVDAGPLYTMGKLAIVGLDLDGEAAIRKAYGIKEGQPFNPEYPERYLKQIKDEGVFDNLGETKAENRINAKDHTVDVTLTFKGAPPQSKQGRGGRGDGPPF
ncbi:MAG TPA: POTRA domain-containing protein [Bryobacteraceae bacterium]|nr:POTRA domain-containing protein [Bryobacteraceae bacterium]